MMAALAPVLSMVGVLVGVLIGIADLVVIKAAVKAAATIRDDSYDSLSAPAGKRQKITGPDEKSPRHSSFDVDGANSKVEEVDENGH
ncbi:hypothetical protein N7492_006612 [Penicillium capsulatum]|uniref:Uncharacterized protein n=1 Tax=Penicillium capsulatum TaxID=69766 RepID=A0A9W9I1Q5_9EURO|nr:hypothetical protein N7492_006612 [Penicillium capsulatum]KAJ6116447.1 hypothetical protein N7512_006172 [Penicillium capsulatum]